MKKHGEILSFLNFNFNLLKKFSEKKDYFTYNVILYIHERSLKWEFLD